MFRRTKAILGTITQRVVAVRLSIHVMCDKKFCAIAHRFMQCVHGCTHVIAAVDGFSYIVQQCSEEKLLIPRAFGPRQLKNLETVIEGIAFRVISRILLNGFQRQQQRAKERVSPIVSFSFICFFRIVDRSFI